MDTKLASSLEDLQQLFNSRMTEYEKKLDTATSGSEPTPEIASITREFTEFKSFIWQALSKFKAQIELLSHGLDRHETYMRRKVLLLHGITEKPNEKLHDVVHKMLSDQMQMTTISKNHIHVCHRLGSMGHKSRPILVRFYSIEHRHLVWDNKTSLKGSGITVSEFLTHARHKTFMAARSHFGMRKCWSTEGRIVISTDDNKRHRLETPGELQALMARYPKSNAADSSNQSTVPPRSTADAKEESAQTENRRPRRRVRD